MRSISLLSVLAASAVAYLGPTDNPVDPEWSSRPDPTAVEYLERYEIPVPAASINEVVPGTSYVVKLECLGCPFRVSPFMSTDEYFAKSPENSLLLNFTVGAGRHTLELNSQRILPLTIPTKIWAHQTPSNLTTAIMQQIIHTQMLDTSFAVATKYSTFELSYEHITTLAEPGVGVLRFDVTNIDITTSRNPGNLAYALSRDAQKAVEITVSQRTWEEGLRIQSIALVDRVQAIPHGKMACGREAPIVDFNFRSTEWDSYGRIGSWSRSLLIVWEKGMDWFVDSMPSFCVVALVLLVVSIVRQRQARLKAERAAAERELYLIQEEEGLLLEVVEGLLEIVDEEGKLDEEWDVPPEEMV